MKTTLQLRKATAKAQRKARKAWDDYATIPRAYREGKATVAELAHALAEADRAAAEQAIAEANETAETQRKAEAELEGNEASGNVNLQPCLSKSPYPSLVQPHGPNRLRPSLRRFVFRSELRQETGQTSLGIRRVVVFRAQIQIKPQPLPVVRELLASHLRLLDLPAERNL
jgi:hypothetical protein